LNVLSYGENNTFGIAFGLTFVYILFAAFTLCHSASASNALLLDHFEFEPLDSPQIVGIAFDIKITARDQFNAVLTSYNGVNNLTYSMGTITPTSTTAFTSGVWVGSVVVSAARCGLIGEGTILTVGEGVSGTSGTFNVNAASTPIPTPSLPPMAPASPSPTTIYEPTFVPASPTALSMASDAPTHFPETSPAD